MDGFLGRLRARVFFGVLWLKFQKPLLVLITLTFISVCTHQCARRPFPGHTRHGGFAAKKSARERLIPAPGFFLDWRKRFLEVAKPLDGDGLVRGIFLGEDEFIPETIRESFKEAGLYHLLAASGFNCWIVAQGFIWLARLWLAALWFRLPSTVALTARKYTAPVAAFFGAWCFFFWSDQSPPIQRAAVMVTTKCVLQAMGIQASFSRLLFVHYLGFLLFFPRLWSNASFQLTFGCLFGMIAVQVLTEPLRERLGATRSHPVRRFFFESCRASFGACLGALPTTWLVFGEVNFTGVLTNFVAIPLTSMFLMPAALCAMLTVPVSETAAGFFLQIAVFFAKALARLLEFFQSSGISLRYED